MVPCPRCDYFCEKDEDCFKASCNAFNCVNGRSPSVVSVCFQKFRSDIFAFRENRKPNEFVCRMQVAGKRYTTEFRKGVTNVQTLEFNEGQQGPLEYDSQDNMLKSCSLKVDGKLCNSCSYCRDFDFGTYAMDCSNIVVGATTYCDSYADSQNGIVAKLLVLQDEDTTHPSATAPPSTRPLTEPPQATTLSPATTTSLPAQSTAPPTTWPPIQIDPTNQPSTTGSSSSIASVTTRPSTQPPTAEQPQVDTTKPPFPPPSDPDHSTIFTSSTFHSAAEKRRHTMTFLVLTNVLVVGIYLW